ncbi:dihydropyrimidinase [Niveomyces insectorum RCEF 264]|uniref:dihydropyrimidinase n=1 Tax=Niveomyces insectorum RCEF 264 TaxID=1081102 RepID=A0A167VRB5_9HYPO|nr:dihydropyrimidinase [Niveomyces insectorum RCEF 264]
MLDLIIRNGRIVTAAEILPAGLEIGVKNGKIAVIGTGLEAGNDTEVVDAEGAYITPGYYTMRRSGRENSIQQDNSPTGDTWETGTRSALAGGNTTIIAFATQKRQEASIWPSLAKYHAKAKGNSYCDYGLHLILTNASDDVLEKELPRLPEQGITSVKLYMTYQPLKLTDGDLFNVIRLAKKGNLQTYFHAVARPQIAENEATYRAISLAEVTDTPILLVHMSAPTALSHVRAAQARLLPIHAETCPHYLYLTSSRLRSGPHQHDIEGATHICAPPLRHDAQDLETLWQELANGTYTIVSSDHAPARFDHADGKQRALVRNAETGQTHVDFRAVPNGLPGIETRLPLLFHRTYDPEVGPPGDELVRISLPRFVALTSTNPAQLYGLAHCKGSLQPGLDADIVIWYPEAVPTVTENGTGGGASVNTTAVDSVDGSADLVVPSTHSVNGDPAVQRSPRPARFTIRNADLHHRIDYTPFEGMEVRNWPRYVFLRGQRVWDRDHGGVLGAKGDGAFLMRKRSRILTGQMGRTATGMTKGEWGSWM